MITAFAPGGLPISGWIAVAIFIGMLYAHHTRDRKKDYEWDDTDY